MTLQELMSSLRADLAHVPSENTMRDLRILAAHALGIERGRVTLHLHDDVSQDQEMALRSMVEQRAAHMPISKIVQRREFWGRDFFVNEHVLDPRADTETLIEACFALGPQAQVLDLGTGSGAIALTLAAEWGDAQITATDISAAALDVARRNAAAFGLSDRVTLVHSDWFDALEGRFDLIVSNPPYIAADEMDGLSQEVRLHDPFGALSDGAEGLSAYRIIAEQAAGYLQAGGHVLCEIGWTQSEAVKALFVDAGFDSVQCLKDIDGRPRVVRAALGKSDL